jgi:hypothetical protein
LSKEYLATLQKLAPNFEYVIDKNPANGMVAGALQLALPYSRIIHMQRNAIDCVISIWTTHVRTSADFVCNRENIVLAYKEYLRLAEHWQSVIPENRFLNVHYEDLIEDPERITHQMTDFLGIEWENALIHPEENPQAVRTPSYWQVRQPFYKGSKDRWKRYEPWLGAFKNLAGL